MLAQSLPRHIVIQHGRITSRPLPSAYQPRVIDYVHTVRIMTPGTCNRCDEVNRNKKDYETSSRLKQAEIEVLIARLNQRDYQLARQKKEIEGLVSSKSALSITSFESSIKNPQDTGILTEINGLTTSRLSEEPFQVDFRKKKAQYINLEALENEWLDTTDAISNLGTALAESRIRRKYTFHNKMLERRLENLTNSQRLDDSICMTPRLKPSHRKDLTMSLYSTKEYQLDIPVNRTDYRMATSSKSQICSEEGSQEDGEDMGDRLRKRLNTKLIDQLQEIERIECSEFSLENKGVSN